MSQNEPWPWPIYNAPYGTWTTFDPYPRGAPMPPKKPKAKPSKAHQGWLVLALGDEETAMPGGKAVRLAAALCPDADGPTVGEVRAAFPESAYVGQTADGQAVSLRSLVADDEPDE